MDGITSPVEDESGNVGAIVFNTSKTETRAPAGSGI
jgi:hypothetical protein